MNNLIKIFLFFTICATAANGREIGTLTFGSSHFLGRHIISNESGDRYDISPAGFSVGLYLPLIRSAYRFEFHVNYSIHDCSTSQWGNESYSSHYGYIYNSLVFGKTINTKRKSIKIIPKMGLGFMGESIIGEEGTVDILLEFPLTIQIDLGKLTTGIEVNYKRIIVNDVDYFDLRNRFGIGIIVAK